MTLDDIQAAVKQWTAKNFGPPVTPFHRPVLGMMEELGELAHARLKKEQGIRGTPEEHDANARDAIGDLVIYLMDFCNSMEWNLQQIVEETWTGVVQKRDWNKNPIDGVMQ